MGNFKNYSYFGREQNWTINNDTWCYRGEIDPQTHLPEGLGVKGIKDEEERIIETLAGFFHRGELEGFGYRLKLLCKEEEYLRETTYEEVMSSAEFDSAGRAISYGVGSHVREKRLKWGWERTECGLWREGEFVQTEHCDLTAWGERELKVLLVDIDGENITEYTTKRKAIRECSAEGMMELFNHPRKLWLTPFHEKLMVQDGCELFLLEPGGSHTFDEDPDRPTYHYRYLYALI